MNFSMEDIATIDRYARMMRDTPIDERTHLLRQYHVVAPNLGDRCSELLSRYDKAKTQKEKRAIGYALESVTGLLFAGIVGCRCPESFRSSGSQIDLLVQCQAGNPTWPLIQRGIGFPIDRPGILVEVKATRGRVSSEQMLRLCALIESHFNNVGLGVFVALEGASGHPTRDGKKTTCVRDAKLHQLLYATRTSKPIVVLDRDDLQSACSNGDFLGLLAERVLDLHLLHGTPPEVPDQSTIVPLPSHLNEMMQWHSTL